VVVAFLRQLKWVWYPLFFVTVFLVSLYLTFPADAIKGYVVEQIENALAGQGTGQWVVPPRVSIGKMSLWRLSGMKMKDVELQAGSQTPQPGSKWEFESLKIRLGLFSTLRGFPKVEFDSDLYEGRVRGGVVMTKKGGIGSFWFDISDINLRKLTGLSETSTFPVMGTLNMDADFDLGKNPAMDGEGGLNFSFKKFAIGPGKLELPMPGMEGGLSVPKVNFGEFSGQLSLKKGKGKTQNIRLTGGDIEANLNADIDLNKNIMRSTVDGAGWFSIHPKFLAANPQFKSILEISSELRNARGSDGRYPFSIKGTLERPYPKWGKG
jgi:type II secretion system protein N